MTPVPLVKKLRVADVTPVREKSGYDPAGRTAVNCRAFSSMVGVACLFVLMGAAPSRAQGSADALPNMPTITTVGDGLVKRPPDRAFVTISVESRAKTPRDAQAQNAEAMTAVQQRLRAFDLPKDAVRTVGYGVDAEFDFVNGRRVLRDYLARNAIDVRLDDLNRVGAVVDAATTSGATSIGGVRFDLKDRAAAEREALSAAVADARARADAIATAAGHPGLTIWRISEEGAAEPPGPRPMTARAFSASAAPPETPISAGDIEIRARVTMIAIMK